MLGGVLGALVYIVLIEIHHVPGDDGETGYELQSVFSTNPEFTRSRTQENGLGMGNMAFTEDGMRQLTCQGPTMSVVEKTLSCNYLMSCCCVFNSKKIRKKKKLFWLL